MRIRLKRPKSKNYDESKYKIFINGEKVAILKESQLFELEISNPSITLEAKLNWTGSKKLNLQVSDGDTIEFLPNSFFSKAGLILPGLMVVLWSLINSFNALWIKWLLGIMLLLVIATLMYILVLAHRKWIKVIHIKH